MRRWAGSATRRASLSARSSGGWGEAPSVARSYSQRVILRTSAARFGPVQARFRQQNVDAISFSEVIVGFYLNISGHRFPEARGSGR